MGFAADGPTQPGWFANAMHPADMDFSHDKIGDLKIRKFFYLGLQIRISRILAAVSSLIVLVFVAVLMGISFGPPAYVVLGWCIAYEPVTAFAALIAVGLERWVGRAVKVAVHKENLPPAGCVGRLLGLAILGLAVESAAELTLFIRHPIFAAGFRPLCYDFSPPLVLATVGTAILLARPVSCDPIARRTVGWVLAWFIFFVLLGITLSI